MAKYDMDTRLSEILADSEACAIIEEYIPGFAKSPQIAFVKLLKVKALIGKGHMVGLTPEKEKEMLDRIASL